MSVALMDLYTATTSTYSETLAVLAKRKDGILRATVAGNRHTTPEILVSLASDEDERVLFEVAGNRNTPYGIWLQFYGRVMP